MSTSLGTLLSPEEVAGAVGLTVRSIYKAVREGELPAFKLRGRLRIRQEDVEAWLDQARV